MDRRKYRVAFGAFIGILVLILDSRCAVEGGQQAAELCIRTIVPSLFPFLFLSGLITNTFKNANGRILKTAARIFHIPSGGESILLCGILGGYPAGAIAIGESFRNGRMNRKTAEQLLAYSSNAGPAFLFGILASQFPEKEIIWSIWGIHLFSAALVGMLLPCSARSMDSEFIPDISLSENMARSVKTMATICGWILLFRILIVFLDKWILWLFPKEVCILIWGFLELSNGCCRLYEIENVTYRFIIACAMLSFGGVCVAMQTASVVAGISVKKYIWGKLLQTVISVILAALICHQQYRFLYIIFGIFLIFPKIRKKRSSIPMLSDV